MMNVQVSLGSILEFFKIQFRMIYFEQYDVRSESVSGGKEDSHHYSDMITNYC